MAKIGLYFSFSQTNYLKLRFWNAFYGHRSCRFDLERRNVLAPPRCRSNYWLRNLNRKKKISFQQVFVLIMLKKQAKIENTKLILIKRCRFSEFIFVNRWGITGNTIVIINIAHLFAGAKFPILSLLCQFEKRKLNSTYANVLIRTLFQNEKNALT